MIEQKFQSQRCTVVQSTVVWAVRLSIGNKRFRHPPVEQKRVNRSKPNLAGKTTLGMTLDKYKKWGLVERWRPHVVAVCQTFFPLFYSNQPTCQTQLSPMTYYASNDVVPLIHVPFGGKSRKISHFGGLRPPKPPKFPPKQGNPI